MARARNIKPGFFKNEDLAECSPWARLCFAGLWVLADRDGRLEDRPKRIKGELFPFDTVEVEPLLQELCRFKFIERYETDGMKAIQITNFGTHQTPHYSEKKSVIKPPRFQENGFDDEQSKPGEDQEKTRSKGVLKRGSQPPDSLIPDSLIPEQESANALLSPAELTTGDDGPDFDLSGDDRPGRLPPCPYEALISIYHEVLPEMPKVRLRTDDRKKALSNTWKWVLTSHRTDGERRATTAEEAKEWFVDYFTRARGNDFLMGRNVQRGGEHANWRCDLDFLLTNRGLKHVIEKTPD